MSAHKMRLRVEYHIVLFRYYYLGGIESTETVSSSGRRRPRRHYGVRIGILHMVRERDVPGPAGHVCVCVCV